MVAVRFPDTEAQWRPSLFILLGAVGCQHLPIQLGLPAVGSWCRHLQLKNSTINHGVVILIPAGCKPPPPKQSTSHLRKTMRILGLGEQWFYSFYKATLGVGLPVLTSSSSNSTNRNGVADWDQQLCGHKET